MKILFTGGTSFTGFWFVEELQKQGHEVTVVVRKPIENYQGVRRKRAEMLVKKAKTFIGHDFGSSHFLEMLQKGKEWDLFCHHAAEVGDYRNPDYDIVKAIDANTRSVKKVLDELLKKNCRKVLVTGSVFEQNEGAGSDIEKAFSPYGCSKALTYEIFKQYSLVMGFDLGKFVISNPFGPYEEARYTHYLMRTWYAGDSAQVKTPLYIRDNIPVSLLKKCYADFVHQVGQGKLLKANPSGYPESQAAFTRRFSNEMSARLPLKCAFELCEQTDFSEPRIRINTEQPDYKRIGWDERQSWDELAEYYESILKGQ